jgi:HTH-type transcriptional regulator, competence development regulator
MTEGKAIQTSQSKKFGEYIRKRRSDLQMSLRDIEEATGKEVSNAYLSQLETGKITKPSPHILYSLSTALGIDYAELMERAGYIVPAGSHSEGTKHGRAATFSIDNLTADEENALLDYLNYIRSKRR